MDGLRFDKLAQEGIKNGTEAKPELLGRFLRLFFDPWLCFYKNGCGIDKVDRL
jgi:hypothetical protein